ncbi:MULTISPECIES: DUF2937 family protein [unclassified Roseovarius]|uniref:DUF2937 family protein n=1 Tax=unclassified Roseovarius TaxID=2614913 RepID=UPI00273E8490|nr:MULTISPECIES: DUF2937 family protein [unclassified Roseovarius]
MFLRAVTLVGGIAGAVAFSQFPEYSQQYTQRLAGAVDELSRVVQRFDTDASALGLSRQEALNDMERAGGMAEARAQSMQRVFVRYDRLSNDLKVLRPKAPVGQAVQIWRMTDPELARKAWDDFKPAVPVTITGISMGLVGFLAGLLVFGTLRAVLRGLFWRKRAVA